MANGYWIVRNGESYWSNDHLSLFISFINEYLDTRIRYYYESGNYDLLHGNA